MEGSAAVQVPCACQISILVPVCLRPFALQVPAGRKAFSEPSVSQVNQVPSPSRQQLTTDVSAPMAQTSAGPLQGRCHGTGRRRPSPQQGWSVSQSWRSSRSSHSSRGSVAGSLRRTGPRRSTRDPSIFRISRTSRRCRKKFSRSARSLPTGSPSQWRLGLLP